MELEITWGRVIRVWGAYFWRYLIALVVAIIIGAIIGFILGFVGAAVGIPTGITGLVAGLLGGLLGLVGCIIPLKMILGKNYREFRLVLLSTDLFNAVNDMSINGDFKVRGLLKNVGGINP